MKRYPNSIAKALGRDSVHPFPARMAASVALDAVSRARAPLRVLDPMMGSGTVVALAQAKGHAAHGVDIDPLAVLIANVWTTPISKGAVRSRAALVLSAARTKCARLPLRNAYPQGADEETKKFVRYWFDRKARRQLATLAAEISGCRSKVLRNVLWCAFSRLIISKQAGASLALDLAHSRPHKAFSKAPREPFEWFIASVETVLANCIDRTKNPYPSSSVSRGDARNLQHKSGSIDLVLTSPPYLNAIDYMRCSKFSLIWMGRNADEIREIRGASIGAERGIPATGPVDRSTIVMKSLRIKSKLSPRHQAILRKFVEDIYSVFCEVRRVLAPGGRAIFVVGENAVRGTYVRNAKIIRLLAEEVGLTFVGASSRTLPPNRRYLPPPSKDKGAINLRMTREVVVTFKKPRNSKRKAHSLPSRG